MEITGRLTKDAVVNKTSKGEVISFFVAVNYSYKPKGAMQYVQQATYFNCAYWKRTKIISILKKGRLVQLSGELKAYAYIKPDGKAVPDLRFHTNEIKILSKVELQQNAARSVEDITEPIDDLPF